MSNIEVKFDNNIMCIRDTNTGKTEKTLVVSSNVKSKIKRLIATSGTAIPSHIWTRLATTQKT